MFPRIDPPWRTLRPPPPSGVAHQLPDQCALADAGGPDDDDDILGQRDGLVDGARTLGREAIAAKGAWGERKPRARGNRAVAQAPPQRGE